MGSGRDGAQSEGSPESDRPLGVSPIDGGPAGFTEVQRVGLEVRRADQDRTLEAVHRLEAALASAAPRREGTWHNDVVEALEILDDATAGEEANAALPESLLSDIARTQPRLRHRVRGLRAQYRQLRDTVGSLRRELEESGVDIEIADVRRRLAWLLDVLRHHRARESDLIYEAYYEAFKRDVEEDLRRGP
ncbi:MAG: hypothetical protein ACYDAD_15925 [Acidimicrobiales bacterium]